MRRMRTIGFGILGLGLVGFVVGIVQQATVPDELPFPSSPAPGSFEESSRRGDAWFESVVRANEARRSATELTYAGFFLACLGGGTLAATSATLRRGRAIAGGPEALGVPPESSASPVGPA